MGNDVKGLAVLRRRCASHLRSLDLPVPFNLESFCRSLAERRHRPIVLRAIDGPAGLGGFWVASSQADYILYQAGTSSLHRLHIILHELSHLICEHKPAPVTDDEFLRIMLPDLSPRAFRHMLKRAAYSTAEDQEAEMLATLLSARITHHPTEPSSSVDPEVVEVSRRLVSSLEYSGSVEP
jgi:hypothetical protein